LLVNDDRHRCVERSTPVRAGLHEIRRLTVAGAQSDGSSTALGWKLGGPAFPYVELAPRVVRGEARTSQAASASRTTLVRCARPAPAGVTVR
jgi:hypothetical protein